jgi:transcriptional regulator with XRE-family HTH domain
MQDFADLLVAARERAGLTQSQAAQAAGLTPSYLSLIENRKKPPPSDRVCERLAKVLGVPPRQLLEVAHLERAPRTVRQRVRTLDSRLRRERRSRTRILESLLSPVLFQEALGFLEDTFDWIGSAVRRRRLRELLTSLGARRDDRAPEIARLVDDLPERDRRLLLETLPRLLSEREKRTGKATGGPPPLLYALPPPGETPAGPFLLAWSEETPDETTGGVHDGDQLLLDPGTRPAEGDLVVVRAMDGTATLRRLVRTASGLTLPRVGHARAGAEEPLFDEDGMRMHLQAHRVGTVMEIRRPLRRRQPMIER